MNSVRAVNREIEAILDQARWAPSAENTQPWYFDIIDNDHVLIHLRNKNDLFPNGGLFDTKDNQLMFLAGGMLLETMRIAASPYNRSLSWILEEGKNKTYHINVTMQKDRNVTPDPLACVVSSRSVDRRPYHMTPLTPAQKENLTQALGDEFAILWRESFSERWRLASLSAMADGIRLRIPETFVTHQRTLDWEHDFAPFGIPGRAIGFDRCMLLVARWLMQDWKRLDFMNHYGGGPVLAQLEMDIVPGLFCGAHFIIFHKANQNFATPEAIIQAGRASQRFWLTATSKGLAMQPIFAPPVFASYARDDYPFTVDRSCRARAELLRKKFMDYAGMDIGRIAFMGRIGVPRSHNVTSRSTRLSLEELMKHLD